LSGMVDISSKPVIYREARACGKIFLRKETIKAIKEKRVEKGDPIEVARVSATLAVKNTPQIIPYCHPIPIESVKVFFDVKNDHVEVCVDVKTSAKTGVEMEALTGVSAALLTIWDMVKYLEKDERGQYPVTKIHDIKVIEKLKGQQFSLV
jgi:cyclic pyranopterin phosphate synthase